jgi:hypothetical protein
MSTSNAFANINTMLMQNRCFLCEETFQRGKTKKVFQVADMLEFYLTVAQQEKLNPTKTVTFKSKNLKDCYDCFKSLVVIDDNGNVDSVKVISELKNRDIETWMSGLICGTNPICQEESAYFVKDLSAKSNQANQNQGSSIFKSTVQDKECPPGCNCDNPWPFLT